jgi:hypothetical protein
MKEGYSNLKRDNSNDYYRNKVFNMDSCLRYIHVLKNRKHNKFLERLMGDEFLQS